MKKSIWTKAFWKSVTERALRGAAAAEVGAYVAGNLVFDATDIKLTISNFLAIAVGGAVSAFGLSVVGNAVTKNGPSFTDSEVLSPPAPDPTPDERGEVDLSLGLLIAILLGVVLLLFRVKFGG
jgi:hypothetical protein